MSTFLNRIYKKLLAGMLIGILLSISISVVFLPVPKAQAQIAGCAAAFAQAIATAIGQATLAAPFSIPIAANGQIFSQAEVSGQSLQDFITNCIEHAIALAIAKALLDQLTQSIVGYISGGFKGSPAFIGNPGKFFSNFGLGIAADFITHFLGNLCLDYQAEIGATLAVNFENVNLFTSGPDGNYDQAAQCADENGFKYSFNNGGWSAWFNMIQDDNNPYNAYADASYNLDKKIDNVQTNEALKIQWGAGFLSQESCTDNVTGDTDAKSYSELDPGNPDDQALLEDYENNEVDCTITTPGQTIAGVLQNQLNIPADQLGVADDFDKILNALGQQILTMGLQTVGLGGPNHGGLLGASAGTNGATSLLALLTQQAQQNANNANNTGVQQLNQTTSGIPTSGPNSATNLAQGKQATQSSTFQNGGTVFNASTLTDGQTSSNGFINGQGAATNIQPNPWMMVDLGKQLTNISKINIYTRDDVPDSNYTSWCNAVSGAACAQPQFTVEIFATNPINNGVIDPTATPIWQSTPFTQKFDASQEPLTVTVPTQYYNQAGEFIVLNGSSPDASLQMIEIQVFQAQIPVITLSGSNPTYVATGGTFTDPGATAKDQNGNTVNVTTSGTVDTTTAGSYTLTYTATDSQGLVATPVTRTVDVQNGYVPLGG